MNDDSPIRTDRWQPYRGGLINLFKYEDQVFRYQNGRLLLRGDNGSGKSRVLALQLPFLFDGEISPSRVEPDRDPAKRMEWHLLMDQHERRAGYTWIEFARLDEANNPTYLTLGCGMEARKGGGAPKRWFFVSTSRVGSELVLVENQTVTSERQLTEQLAQLGTGRTYAKARDYRAAVDDALFKLGPRYRPLIDLLIQLRQPQLMRDMKEEVLSDALSEALPPVSATLLSSVAESFQSLDSDRQRTEAQREMLEAIASFCELYRDYLAVAVRTLCDVVRLGHSHYETATKDLRRIEAALTSTQEELFKNRDQLQLLAQQRAEQESAVATLRDSPEMKQAGELDRSRLEAERLEGDAQEISALHQQALKRETQAKEEQNQRQARTQEQHQRTQTQHQLLKATYHLISADSSPLFAWPEASLVDSKQALNLMVSQRQQGIRHLQQANKTIAQERSQLLRTEDRAAQCRSRVTSAEEAVSRFQNKLREALENFQRDATTWQQGLDALREDHFPPRHDWFEQQQDWLEDGGGGPSPFRVALARGQQLAQEELAHAKAELARQMRELGREQEEVEKQIQVLQSGQQPEPPAPPHRAPRSENRSGAPFWKLFDFQEQVPVHERPAWEAALQSSGLLDAWVFPDGQIDPHLRQDDFLLSQAPVLPSDDNLSAILKPTSADDHLSQLLARIGNHRGAGDCWCDREGHWANGPHRGHALKEEAEFLGHQAREDHRLRQLAEAQSKLQDIQSQLTSLDQESKELAAKTQKLRYEIEQAPADEPLTHLRTQQEFAQQQLTEDRSRFTEAQDAVTAASQKLQALVSKRDQEAEDLKLLPHAEPEPLEIFAEHVATFRNQASELWPLWERYLESRDELAKAQSRHRETCEDSIRQSKKLSQRQEEAAAARARFTTLEGTIGKTVAEVMAQLKGAEQRLQDLKTQSDQSDQTSRQLAVDEAGLKRDLEHAAEKREQSEGRRDQAVSRMESYLERRVFHELDPDNQPERETFSTTAAVEFARQMEKRLRHHQHDEKRWNQLQAALAQQFNELSDQLGRHGLQPSLTPFDERSVSIITCPFQNESRNMRDLHLLLETQLQERERIFEEKEREVIENHLIGEVANDLQHRIREGEIWVENVNRKLAEVTTSSGIQLRFLWTLSEQDSELLTATRRLFLKTSAAWTTTERDTIGRFLQERIQRQREQDESATWSEHLGRALDYRSWHLFVIERRNPGEQAWRRLTRRTFGTGSGGEKALTLTVPQFAAAAAHYESAHPMAPRLILLDEVFVAIDAPTREKLMALLETLDLDYVMTSEREWGTYSTVSALAIYQLASRPGYNAVAVTRWVWNGHHKHEDKAHSDEQSHSIQ